MYTLRPVTENEMATLNYGRFSETHKIVSKRFHAIYQIAQNEFTRGEIAKFLDLNQDTLTDYVHLFNAKGIAGLKTIQCGQHNVSELDAFADILIPNFDLKPPHTSGEGCQRILELTGLKRSPSQVRTFMKRHGLKYLKAGQIPAKADTEKQAQFIENTLNPLIIKAKNEEIHLLFMDSVHPVMSIFLCALWCFKRIFVKSSSGRKRLNILGAVNAMNQQIHFLTNETYINAQVITRFLYQLRLFYFDMKPIHIILDNARYQHCDLVRYIAWQLNIHLVFLPPYSPNLNVIERLWKWMKKKTLYAQYYSTFDCFKGALIENLRTANQKYPDELKNLLNLKFQTF